MKVCLQSAKIILEHPKYEKIVYFSNNCTFLYCSPCSYCSLKLSIVKVIVLYFYLLSSAPHKVIALKKKAEGERATCIYPYRNNFIVNNTKNNDFIVDQKIFRFFVAEAKIILVQPKGKIILHAIKLSLSSIL